MIPLACFIVGLLVGGAAVYWLTRYLRVEVDYYRKELATSNDRLIYAWREERAVPAPRAVEVQPPPKLPGPLVDAVNEWESAEGREAAEAKIRDLHFNQGLGVMAVLKELENQHP